MNEINKQLLLDKYTYRNTNKNNSFEGIKTLIVILLIFGLLSINFIGFSFEIVYILLLLCTIFGIMFFLISGFSNITEKIKCKICANKIKRNQFYIIKDTVYDIVELLGRNENDAQPILKIYFHNKNHWFYTDIDASINKNDEYYIVLFKKGFYGHIFSGLLINPKIIDFYDCKSYFIDNNCSKYWKNNTLDGKYL